jgi:hypothetical protein
MQHRAGTTQSSPAARPVRFGRPRLGPRLLGSPHSRKESVLQSTRLTKRPLVRAHAARSASHQPGQAPRAHRLRRQRRPCGSRARAYYRDSSPEPGQGFPGWCTSNPQCPFRANPDGLSGRSAVTCIRTQQALSQGIRRPLAAKLPRASFRAPTTARSAKHFVTIGLPADGRRHAGGAGRPGAAERRPRRRPWSQAAGPCRRRTRARQGRRARAG